MLDIFSSHTYLMLLIGTALSGTSAALTGAFIYLKRQGTMGDVISHASFPGTMIAFLAGTWLLQDGRNLTLFTVLAIITGLFGALSANYIDKRTPLGTEVSMVATISLYFSFGMLLLAAISASKLPAKGGISDYLLGNATHLTRADTIQQAIVCAVVLAALACGYKRLKLTIFDPDFARCAGLPVVMIERALFVALAAVVVSGMRTVGLLLIVAFAIMPAASARQWCKKLVPTLALSAFLAACCAVCGTLLSITVLQAPTGALIVLLLFIVFCTSLLLAPGRGLLWRGLRRRKVTHS